MIRGRRTAWRQAAVRALLASICGVASLSTTVGTLGAQQAGGKSSPPKAGSVTPTDPDTQSKLDEWIVRRFRGAQLLPDSGNKAAPLVTQSGAPRIEGPRVPEARDTLVALHFNASMWRPSLSVGSVAPLADPTGVASKLLGRITARRAFRAPRRPGVVAANEGDWRIGWAYLLAIPPKSAGAVSTGFDGWLVLEPPIRTRPVVRPAVLRTTGTRPDGVE